VALLLYSGVPDPTWTLDATQVDALTALIDALGARDPAEMPTHLGYRGFRVDGLEDTRLTVAAGIVERRTGSASAYFADPERTVERCLLPSGEGALKPAEREIVEADLAIALPAPSGFALTLTRSEVRPSDVQALGDLAAIKLEDEPFLTRADFTRYDAATHAFTLTPEAEARLLALDLPVSGRAFVVSVDGVRIYTGAFWTPLSSLSYDGVTIMLMEGFGSMDPDGVYTIDLGYPGSGFFEGPDPRSDPRILRALR